MTTPDELRKMFVVVNNVGRFDRNGKIAVTKTELAKINRLLLEARANVAKEYLDKRAISDTEADAIHYLDNIIAKAELKSKLDEI